MQEGFALPEASLVNNKLLPPAQAVAVLDCSKEGFPVKSLSSGFCMRVGRLPLASWFTHVVKQGDRSYFRAWMQEALLSLALHEKPDDCQITLRMPHGEVMVACTMLLDDSASANRDSGEKEHRDLDFVDVQNV
mmetsp:Transcript_12454/g.14084  ORF Transcript_12454/g.14084 Transcript_12454/m.14084 type:complete len:134 (+) Transcript_12454:190-591(+)